MGKPAVLGIFDRALFFGSRQESPNRCVDFIKELERSLNLLNAGFLAGYFPQAVAATAALTTFLFLMKAFKQPKRIAALISLPIVYIIVLSLTKYATANVFSYCF